LPALEHLLQPIADEAPAGRNLRYDPIYDQILEARSEEDSSLPAGNWLRPARKADYPRVLALCEEVLAKGSKDLWIAAWLGEAQIHLQGLSALSATLDLLLQMQTNFWDSLYPEIEDGDGGLRSAPLQWAMDRYSALVYDLSSAGEGLSYRAYKSARASRAAAVSDPQPENDGLEAALNGTSKAFYVSMESDLASAREALEKLRQFTDGKYGDEGPSTTKFRTALEEVHNLVVSLLRARKEIDPDPAIAPAAESKPLLDVQPAASAEVGAEPPSPAPAPSEQPAVELTEEAAPRPDPLPATGVAAARSSPRTRQQALDSIRECAAYLAREDSSNPVAYLQLAAMQWGLRQSDELKAPIQSPPSELRTVLRQAWLQHDWDGLLGASLDALTQPCAAAWLDLHHYVWRAARERGYDVLARCVVDFARMILQESSDGTEVLFEDGTPAASAETRQWIVEAVPGKAAAATEPEPSALPPQPAPPPQPQEEASAFGITAEAEALAARGDLSGSVALLMQNAAASPARRISFQRRLQASRLCLAAGQRSVASSILQQLLGESDRYCLESWEGPDLVGEVLSMLLESLAGAEKPDLDRGALLSRLCQVDPVRALRLEPQFGARP
jgi:type VI secretion system protein ImpA